MLKKMILTHMLIITVVWAQSGYHAQRASLFELMPVDNDDIIFLGNSITDGGNWSELFNDQNCKNRGISGDVSEGVLNRLGSIVEGQPAKIFIMIGINDLASAVPVLKVAQNYTKILEAIQAGSPNTAIYIQSILPVNPNMGKFPDHTDKSAEVAQLNWHLRRIATQYNCTYVDLYSEFISPGNLLAPDYTNDGLHLTGAGYLKWRDELKPYMEQ